MKAITLTQPWATLVAIGAKRFETRSWATGFRGPLAIHAAKGFPRACKELCSEPEFVDALASINARFSDLPLGCVVATVTLVGCFKMGTADAPCTADLTRHFDVSHFPECRFGDFSEGRFAWVFDNLKKLHEPIPAKGALGLWEWKP